MFYKRKAISRAVYDFCVKQEYADAKLIAKWRKSGYEKLCCLRCIQPKDTNFGTTCICRVPAGHLKEGKIIECMHCGFTNTNLAVAAVHLVAECLLTD